MNIRGEIYKSLTLNLCYLCHWVVLALVVESILSSLKFCSIDQLSYLRHQARCK